MRTYERWASVADFLLLARSRTVVGALSSTFSELAGAVAHEAAVDVQLRRIADAARKAAQSAR